MFKKIGLVIVLIGQSTFFSSSLFAEEMSGDHAFLISNNAKEGKVLNLQSWLAVMGFPAGELDGSMGPMTRQTIKDYQKSLKQKETGSLDAKWETPLELAVRKKVQEKLKSLKFYEGEVDGLHGEKMSAAIKAYAKANDLEDISDTMSAALLATLFNDSITVNSVETTDTPENVEDNSTEDETVTISPNDTNEASSSTPHSIESSKAIIASEDANKATETKNITQEDNVGLKQNDKEIRFKGYKPGGDKALALIQLKLAYLGFYDLLVDGTTGPTTIEASRKFQAAHGLTADGHIGKKDISLLTQKTIAKFQEMLKRKGLFDEAVTGTLGPKTLIALHAYQKDNYLQISNQIDIPLLVKLLESEEIAVGFTDTDTDKLDDVSIIKQENAQKSVVLEKTPELNANDQNNMLTEKNSHSFKGYKMGGDDAMALNQLKLAYLGVYDAIVDGKTGATTTAAIKRFQTVNKLNATGSIDKKTETLLTEKTITKFQEMLLAQNMIKDAPTGTMGPKTRNALKDYRKLKGLTPSDKLNIPSLLLLLDTEKGGQMAKAYEKQVSSEQASKQIVSQVQGYLITLGYLSGSANGKLDKATKDAVLRFRRSEGLKRSTEINTALLPFIESSAIKKMQSNLRLMGYKNPVDGKLGASTQQAIKDYQKKNKLRSTGDYSNMLLAKMNRAVREREQANNRRAPRNARVVQNNANVSTRIRSQRYENDENMNVESSAVTPKTPDIIITTRSNSAKQSLGKNQGNSSALMPNLSTKVAQENELIRAEPNTAIQGKMKLLRSDSGQITGCKISNITISSDWCTGSNKEGSSCNVLYKNGRVLSVRCR